jgi:uncharacterized protein YwqG
MTAAADEFRTTIQRRAICLEIGGFRNPDSPATSWFGHVAFALPGEFWPCMDRKPMHALCQINLTELPFRPPRLDDLEFITVFIGPDELPTDGANSNGTNWCLRAYPSIAQLVPLSSPQTGSLMEPFPMRPKIIEEDYPCREDVPCAVPPELDDQYFDLFQNVPGFKMGGWPTLIQSEIYWAPWKNHLISPEYVFQIDSTEKGNWMWGDSGVGYFGRGTAIGRQNEWAVEWQCY